MTWRVRPVFVSSTFQDMQAERDHLRTYVFPELEERLRAARVHLEWVDLRLGVVTKMQAGEREREQQVLKVCLSEARRCRPFLIVLLGDRYGWIPPGERIVAAAAEEGLDTDVAGCSVTDLEIQVGVLASQLARPRCFVYLRDPLPYDEMPADVAALYADSHDPQLAAQERAIRLAAMKRRLEASLPDRVRHYRAAWDAQHSRVTDLDSWGRTVLEDLWRELSQDVDTGSPELPPAQAERNALEDFSADRARDFAGRERLLNYLIRCATSPPERGTAHSVCVTGEPGSGKSALFGELNRRLLESGLFVLSHATDASLQSSSVESMLQRFVEELAGALGVDSSPAMATNAETLDTTFASFLGRLSVQRRVIVLLDGLEQFEQTPRGRFLTWLPKLWPQNARLIATTAQGDASRTLSERPGVEITELPPLDAGEGRQITKAICARYHRAIEPDVLDALLAKASPAGLACGHPLWLTIAAEELNLLDADDFQRAARSYSGTVAERLRSLMLDMVSALPADAAALYCVTFDRAEELFGPRFAQAFLAVLALSGSGWRETDFRALLPRLTGEPWDSLRFAALRRLFRGQLRQRGTLGQWDVNHAQMRAAAYARLTTTWRDKVRAAIVEHLLCLDVEDPLRVSEAPRHLLAAGDWRRTAAYYGEQSLSDASVKSTTRALADYLVLASATDPAAPARIVTRLIGHAGASEGVRDRIARRLLFFLTDALDGRVSLDSQIAVASRIEEEFRALLAASPGRVSLLSDLSIAQNMIGRLLKAAGRVADALEAYSAAKTTFETLAESDKENRLWAQGVAMTCQNIGDLLFGSGRLEDALKAYLACVTIDKRLADADPSDRQGQLTLATSLERTGRALMARGGRAEAVEIDRASAAILMDLVNADPENIEARSALVGSLHGIGLALAASGDREEALATYRRALSVAETVSAADPEGVSGRRDLAVSHERIGDILIGTGDAEGARAAWEQSLAIREKLAAADPANAEWQRDVANSLDRVGSAYHFVGHGREALEHYAQAIEILQDLLAHDPENREWRRGLALTLQKKADSLDAAERLEEALAENAKSLSIFRELAAADRDDVNVLRELAACVVSAGDLLDDLGRPERALACYQEAQGIRERLAASDPGNAESRNGMAIIHSRLGKLLAAAGQDEEALHAYRRSLEILAALAESDPENPMHQFNMTIAHEAVGRILARDRIDEALEEYRTSVATAERLVGDHPGQPDWENLLLGSYKKLRDILATAAADRLDCRHELMYRHSQVGELHARAGRLTQALAAYREQLAVAESLAADEPGDPGRQRDLSVAYSAIGDILAAAGQPEDALASYQEDLAIAERLAAADPANTGSQWDLSISYNQVGDAMLANNQMEQALLAFQDGLTIRARIAPDHPDRIAWQRGLAVSYNKVASGLISLERNEEALEYCRLALAIAARLAALQPDNDDWRHGLAASYVKLANVLSSLGKQDEALEAYYQSKAVNSDVQPG